MTKEQFNEIGWNRSGIVEDGYGHKGHVISVNFEYGVIHYDDDIKQCSFGRHYRELRYCNIPKKEQ